jgi:hypothetical protein
MYQNRISLIGTAMEIEGLYNCPKGDAMYSVST